MFVFSFQNLSKDCIFELFFILKFTDDKAVREQSNLAKNLNELSSISNEMEASMHQASVENHMLEGKLKQLRKEMERNVNNKTQQENDILALLQDQVTADQASKQRGRNIRELQNKRRNMELLMNNTEAQLSEILFELEKLKGIICRSKNYVDDLSVGVEIR